VEWWQRRKKSQSSQGNRKKETGTEMARIQADEKTNKRTRIEPRNKQVGKKR